MLGTYTYHEIIRKCVVSFGTLFNNIEIRRVKDSKVEVMKVPLAYGPKQKFLARLRAVEDLSKKDVFQITLPRIAFELKDISPDPSRKVAPTQYIRSTQNDGSVKKVYMPVPYNLTFELSILSKNQDDGLQILEQILPNFHPSFNITVKLIPDLGEYKDFPVTLNGIDIQDDYEGDYDKRRTLIYTLTFTCKTYLYGAITDVTGDLITKVQVDYSTDSSVTATREVRYTVTPDPESADPDDDFGFNELKSEFTDAREWNPVTGQDEEI